MSRTHLRILPLHLNLLLDLWRDLTRGSVDCARTRSTITYTVGLCRLLKVHRGTVMLSSCLAEKVVLVGGCLKVLVARALYVLGSRDLYLNIRPVAHLFLNGLLLASWAIKILSRLIHNTISLCAANSQVHMLGRASSS